MLKQVKWVVFRSKWIKQVVLEYVKWVKQISFRPKLVAGLGFEFNGLIRLAKRFDLEFIFIGLTGQTCLLEPNPPTRFSSSRNDQVTHNCFSNYKSPDPDSHNLFKFVLRHLFSNMTTAFEKLGTLSCLLLLFSNHERNNEGDSKEKFKELFFFFPSHKVFFFKKNNRCPSNFLLMQIISALLIFFNAFLIVT